MNDPTHFLVSLALSGTLSGEVADFVSKLLSLPSKGMLRLLFSILSGKFSDVRVALLTDPHVQSFCQSVIHVDARQLVGVLALIRGNYVRPLDIARSVPGFNFSKFHQFGVFPAVQLLSVDHRDADAVERTVRRLAMSHMDVELTLALFSLEFHFNQRVKAVARALRRNRIRQAMNRHKKQSPGPHSTNTRSISKNNSSNNDSGGGVEFKSASHVSSPQSPPSSRARAQPVRGKTRRGQAKALSAELELARRRKKPLRHRSLVGTLLSILDGSSPLEPVMAPISKEVYSLLCRLVRKAVVVGGDQASLRAQEEMERIDSVPEVDFVKALAYDDDDDDGGDEAKERVEQKGKERSASAPSHHVAINEMKSEEDDDDDDDAHSMGVYKVDEKGSGAAGSSKAALSTAAQLRSLLLAALRDLHAGKTVSLRKARALVAKDPLVFKRLKEAFTDLDAVIHALQAVRAMHEVTSCNSC